MKKHISKRILSTLIAFAIVMSIFSGTGVLQTFAAVTPPATPGPVDTSTAYIASYAADTTGKKITLSIVDERVKFDAKATYGDVRINNISGNFEASASDVTETSINETVTVTNINGPYGAVKYNVVFTNVVSTGEGNTLVFTISYPNSGASIAP
ncbi:MAG: hypothetical protein RR253_03710, partial [Oscillospiraceae bacterium]